MAFGSGALYTAVLPNETKAQFAYQMPRAGTLTRIMASMRAAIAAAITISGLAVASINVNVETADPMVGTFGVVATAQIVISLPPGAILAGTTILGTGDSGPISVPLAAGTLVVCTVTVNSATLGISNVRLGLTSFQAGLEIA